MPSDIASVAAASATVDADLLQVDNKRTRNAPNNRALTGIALTGSAAQGDSAVDVFIDTVLIGRFFNNDTDFPNQDEVIPLEALFWPAGGSLACIVVDAAATNPLNFRYDWEDLG